MKIYTKTGDTGTTSLLGGHRVSKSHPRIESYGTVDELNSSLGLVRCGDLPADVDALLEGIQHQLFELGSQLAAPTNAKGPRDWVTAETIAGIEAAIDQFDSQLEPLQQFILPAGSQAAAGLHLARTICRRAERCVVQLFEMPDEYVADDAVVFLNRIGDLLFVLARYVNHQAGRVDQPWRKTSTED